MNDKVNRIFKQIFTILFVFKYYLFFQTSLNKSKAI